MLDMHTPRPSLAHVTVRFGDADHSSLPLEGATTTELADTVSELGAQHDGDPISIGIEFGGARAPSTKASPSYSSLSH